MLEVPKCTQTLCILDAFSIHTYSLQSKMNIKFTVHCYHCSGYYGKKYLPLNTHIEVNSNAKPTKKNKNDGRFQQNRNKHTYSGITERILSFIIKPIHLLSEHLTLSNRLMIRVFFVCSFLNRIQANHTNKYKFCLVRWIYSE